MAFDTFDSFALRIPKEIGKRKKNRSDKKTAANYCKTITEKLLYKTFKEQTDNSNRYT